jgi:hypothetical protein
MDTTEWCVCLGSFVAHHCIFRALNARDTRKSKNEQNDTRVSGDACTIPDDAKKLYSCYLSHVHCLVTITSCLVYWASRPVDVLSPKFMVEVIFLFLSGVYAAQPRAYIIRTRTKGNPAQMTVSCAHNTTIHEMSRTPLQLSEGLGGENVVSVS